MEIPFRSAIVTAFVYVTEDERRVLDSLRILLPDEVKVRRSKLVGHYGNPILSLEAPVRHKKLLRELWERILVKLRSGELEKLARTVPGRVDETCHFYLRFDKQLAHAGELVLTGSGDAIHLRLKVAAYPAKREVAIGLVEKFMQALASDINSL